MIIIGIDEAGRGPLAGPITLSAFMAPNNLKRELLDILGGKIKDSKQFSTVRRKKIYRAFLKLKKERKIFFCVSHVSNKIIDKRGISKATQLGINRSLGKLQYPSDRRNIVIRLDGLLKAPEEYKKQRTIVGGDGKDLFIACASIVAKVRRDRLMCRLAKKYPKYGFEIHKGYGTLLHRKLIRKHGFCRLHRVSFYCNM